MSLKPAANSKAWKLLDSPSSWRKGERRDAHDPTFCAEEAIYRCYSGLELPKSLNKLLNRIRLWRWLPPLADGDGYAFISSWNDANSYEMVHQTLKELDI